MATEVGNGLKGGAKATIEGMPLNQQHIEELKKIYLKNTGESLSNQEAWDMAGRLIELFRLLIKPEQNNEKK